MNLSLSDTLDDGPISTNYSQDYKFSEQQQRILKRAILSRIAEERLLSLFAEGLLTGTVHTCIGQEFVGATIAECVKSGDAFFSNHRCHGHFLSITDDLEGLIAEVMGKSTGVCGGIGGSQHLCKNGFYSNGIQGGITPIAAGLGLARKFKKTDSISVVFIGDGTLGEGVLYETLNIASKWEIPLLIVLENNGFSQSTAQYETLAGNIDARVDAFGIPCFKGSTWNWENLASIFGEAVKHVRSGLGPAFVRVDTFRLMAHSKGDDNRPQDFVQKYKAKDPLNILLAEGHTTIREMMAMASDRISAAVESAKKEGSLPPECWLPSPRSADDSFKVKPRMASPHSKTRYIRALNETFHDLMAAHHDMILLGEDIGDSYGGAFKATQGLSTKYPDRVRNTPISEAAITGIGIGLALEGFKPIVEIMFGDFSTLAFDQLLNHAAKFRFMYNNQVNVDLILRTPMGGGRGYGPTHSQTLDKHFLGIPGLTVLALNSAVHPEKIYSKLLKGGYGPVFLIENKVGYTKNLIQNPFDGFDIVERGAPFPSLIVQPQSEHIDVCLVGYGGMLDSLIEAQDILFDSHEIVCQLICPTQIYPLNISNLVEDLAKSPLVVIVEEGQLFAGFGAEFIAQMYEAGLNEQIAVARLGPTPTPIPAAGELEKSALISADLIVKAVLRKLNVH